MIHRRQLGTLLGLAFLCVALSLMSPYFLTISNLLNIAQQTSINAIIAAQSGATAPAPPAGMLAQTTAETLAALIMVNLFSPGHPMIFSNWPFVIDLRSGSFCGSGGEISVMNAASAQIGNWLGLLAGRPAPRATEGEEGHGDDKAGAGLEEGSALVVRSSHLSGIISPWRATSAELVTRRSEPPRAGGGELHHKLMPPPGLMQKGNTRR